MDVDDNWNISGIPEKLKSIDVLTLEQRLAQVIDEFVQGEGTTKATITEISFTNSTLFGDGSVAMKISFSKKMDLSWISNRSAKEAESDKAR